MTGLVLPAKYANEAFAELHVKDLERRRAAVAAAVGKRATATVSMDSDEFVSKRVVMEQLLQLQLYVEEKRREDPTYHLPRPSGWKMTLLMLTIPETSDGGVILVDDSREQRSLASPQGVILAMGPACYSDPARFSINGTLTPWHNVGDRITFVKYDATMYQLANGQRIGSLNDTQPVSTLDENWQVPS